jgi:tRNA(fMet)-specific endonuclease VapC
MILLDTDHLSVLKYSESPRYANMTERMQASADHAFATTIVSAEEQLRGWLAELNRLRDVQKQIVVYDRLQRLLDFFGRWHIVPFDMRAAEEFQRLRKQKVRLGTSDLKIASIARAQDVLLLSANLRDFRRVPGLKVESWLDDDD